MTNVLPPQSGSTAVRFNIVCDGNAALAYGMPAMIERLQAIAADPSPTPRFVIRPCRRNACT